MSVLSCGAAGIWHDVQQDSINASKEVIVYVK